MAIAAAEGTKAAERKRASPTKTAERTGRAEDKGQSAQAENGRPVQTKKERSAQTENGRSVREDKQRRSAKGASAGREYLIFSRRWPDLLRVLKRREQILEVLDAICAYLTGDPDDAPPEVSAPCRMCFSLMTADADRMNAAYRRKKERSEKKSEAKRSGAGQKGAPPGQRRQGKKPRCADFDPEEMMRRAIERSFNAFADPEPTTPQSGGQTAQKSD